MSYSENSSYRDTLSDTASVGDYFFCNLGEKNVPSLFCRGFKFWKNKVKVHDDGEETVYFYCDHKKKPPNGVYCKASASARRVEDEEGNITYVLLRINNVHAGNSWLINLILIFNYCFVFSQTINQTPFSLKLHSVERP